MKKINALKSNEYNFQLISVLQQLDLEVIESIIEAVYSIRNKNENCLFIAGNGGSASIAEHLYVDLVKGLTDQIGSPGLTIECPTLSSPLLTAYSNDYKFKDALALQVKDKITLNSVALLFSTSGESKNMINLADEFNCNLNSIVISLTGQMPSKLSNRSDISLFVPSECTAIIEDAFQIVSHMIFHGIVKRAKENEE